MHSQLMLTLVASATMFACNAALAADHGAKVPARVEELLEVFFEAPWVEDGQLSPDGAHFAFLREMKDKKLLATYDAKTKKVIGLPGTWHRDIVDFTWAGPNKLLFWVGYDQLYYDGMYLTDATFKDRRDVATDYRMLLIVDGLPQDPKRALLRDTKNKEYFGELYELNEETGLVHPLEVNPGRVTRWYPDCTGTVKLALSLGEKKKTSLLHREKEGAAWQPLDVPNLSTPVTFDATGRYVLLCFPANGRRDVVQTYDLLEKKFVDRRIEDPVYDIHPWVKRDPATRQPLYVCYDKDLPRFQWMDPTAKKIHGLVQAQFPGAMVLPHGPLGDKKYLVQVESDVIPPCYYALDLTTGNLEPLFANYGKARRRSLAPMRPVTFKARDGYVLRGYLTLPPGRKENEKVPMIAVSHGGPRSRDKWGWDSEVQFFASLGYGVLQVNYRGSTGFGDAHLLKDIIEVCTTSVDDVVDGLRWTVAEGVADEKRLVPYGGSYGGFIALGIATRYPDLPACVISFAGVYDWTEQIRLQTRHRNDFFEWEGDYFPDRKTAVERYRAVSPINHVAAIKAPVLALHGGDDRVVDVQQANRLKKAMLAANKTITVVKEAEGIHGLPKVKDRMTYYRNVAAFLLQHVPPDAAP